MKVNIALSIGMLLALTACNRQTTLVQPLLIPDQDPSRTLFLVQATERVLERRLAAAEVKDAQVTSIQTGTNTAELRMDLPNTEAVQTATRLLSEPFTFDLRIEKQNFSPAKDPQTLGEWNPTGLTGSSLQWVQAIGNSRTGEVSIQLQFTEEGQKILANIFRNNNGKNLGIFVKDFLVSKLSIQGDAVSDNVVIEGIPSAKVAEVFADDVNVGLHVTFLPLP